MLPPRVIRVAIATALGGLISVACNPFADSSRLDPMSLEPLSEDGVVIIDRDGEHFEVSDTFEIAAGDMISSSQSGARVELLERTIVLMGPESQIVVAADNALADPSGSILVRNGAGVTIAFEDNVEVTSSSGLFRINGDRQSSAVMAYAGSLEFQELGAEPVTVDALFEVNITPGQVGTPAPHTFSESNPWDDQYLAAARDLENQLNQFHKELSSVVDGSVVGSNVLLGVLPNLDESVVGSYLEPDDRSVSDVVIASAIARTASNGSPDDAVREALELHERGAPWGIVANIMSADGTRVLDDLQILGEELVNEAADPAATQGPSDDSGQEGQPNGVGTCVSIIDCILDD